MRDIRRGSAWPDSRPGIVAGGGLDLPGRPRPGYSWGEKAGQGGGVRIVGLHFIEDLPGELVLDTGRASAFLFEDVPGELVLDDTVAGGLKLRATPAPAIFVSD